ncbi:MAG: hypothetical protein H6638_15310 [Ardenticatenales bacterium]|nr:hypothetical protein [Ardenticatenales bacterium]
MQPPRGALWFARAVALPPRCDPDGFPQRVARLTPRNPAACAALAFAPLTPPPPIAPYGTLCHR